jgi:hypothetical protein
MVSVSGDVFPLSLGPCILSIKWASLRGWHAGCRISVLMSKFLSAVCRVVVASIQKFLNGFIPASQCTVRSTMAGFAWRKLLMLTIFTSKKWSKSLNWLHKISIVTFWLLTSEDLSWLQLPVPCSLPCISGASNSFKISFGKLYGFYVSPFTTIFCICS